MKDAIGNVYSLGFVFAFILIIASFLAYVINYNRAFQVKNKLLQVIKSSTSDNLKWDGNSLAHESIEKQIKEYKKNMGYGAGIDYVKNAKAEGWTCPENYGWCYKIYPDPKEYKNEDIRYSYVRVMTFVSIDVPLINKIFSKLSNFQVTGSTVPVLTVKSRSE
ncbi:MAG: hypothetical protein J6B89_00015 [Bacilli bacterium]|nr:hypothetical protein [Bacilli bacterium]